MVVGNVVISPMKAWSYMASFVECAVVMYLASVVGNMMMGCFLELHATALPPMKKV